MKRRHAKALFLAILTLASLSARASLGEQSSPATARALRATPAATSSGVVFERHEFALPGGGLATEFRDSNGFVFAVSWNAPTMPDLAALLGAYKSNLDLAQKNAQGQMRSPGALATDDGDLNIVSTGRIRAYKGHSHLKSKLPAGFDIKELEQ